MRYTKVERINLLRDRFYRVISSGGCTFNFIQSEGKKLEKQIDRINHSSEPKSKTKPINLGHYTIEGLETNILKFEAEYGIAKSVFEDSKKRKSDIWSRLSKTKKILSAKKREEKKLEA